MRCFAVICENLDLEQQTLLAAHFGEQNYGFWHRMPSCWLLVCPETISATQLREQITKTIGLVPNYLVMQVTYWSSCIPNEWQEWFVKYWNGKKPGEGSEAEATSK
jgi:hypothetical protein